jgi:hypothetical protein
MLLKPVQLSNLLNCKRQVIYVNIERGHLQKNENGFIDCSDILNKSFLKKRGLTENDVITFYNSLHPDKEPLKLVSEQSPLPVILPKIDFKPKIIKEVKPKKEKKVKTIKEVKPKSKIETIIENKNKVEFDSIIETPIDIHIPVIDEIAETIIEKIIIDPVKNEVDEFENITGLPSKMMNMNLKQLVNRYGGPMMLKNWADILNKLMSANEKDQKIQERRIELVEKDFVVSRLFSYIETLSHQLFDYPESCVDNLIAVVKSKKTNIRAEIINNMQKELSNLISETKNNINRELDNIVSKYSEKKDDVYNDE